MFSEYASKFLAQSQSAIRFRDDENQRTSQDHQRRQGPSGWRTPAASRHYLGRLGNPYQPSGSAHFPFARGPPQAPLFASRADEFREETDEEEHQRELDRQLALEKSRRHLGDSPLGDSSELDDDGSRSLGASGDSRADDERGLGRGGGIRSSWRGGRNSVHGHGKPLDSLPPQAETEAETDDERPTNNIKENLVDVGLQDSLRSGFEDAAQEDSPEDFMDNPPSVQNFRTKARNPHSQFGAVSSIIQHQTDRQTLLDPARPSSSDDSEVPPTIAPAEPEPPRHDAFWGNAYLICMAAFFSTWFLVYLHTQAPSSGHPLGDTIYTILHASYYRLGVYTVVSVILALLWISSLQAYVRPLVYLIQIAVPVILYSFSLYAFISSFKGSWSGASVQDKVMRWLSILPAAFATLWVWTNLQNRRAMEKAIGIVEFSCRILQQNSGLLVVGFGVLVASIAWFWLWLLMFTRVFLGGHSSSSRSSTKFIIDTGTWWLGVFFILTYLWTCAVLSGMQRSIAAATVSQWYFHRLAQPSPTSRQIIYAAASHATTTLFGTICLSAFLTVLIRLPLLLLPSRITRFLGQAIYQFLPTPIPTLISPLTLTYGSIHSQSLVASARGFNQMHFLAPQDATTTTLQPRTFATTTSPAPVLSYRLAKTILHAGRWIMTLALGFGGWVSTARTAHLANSGITGSLYAYIVGLASAVIGWSVLGSMEDVLATVVDAVAVCWGSEVGAHGRGEARYCREAGFLFGDGDAAEDAIAWNDPV